MSSSKLTTSYLSPRVIALLAELEEDCHCVLKFLAQLDTPKLNESQVEDILGGLSAVILHIHEHTRGLDEIIDEDVVKAQSHS
jgi:hypothetical protein